MVPIRGKQGLRFLRLDDFLAEELFGNWPSVVTFNRAEGLGFSTPEARRVLRGADEGLRRGARHDLGATGCRATPPNCFALLDSYFRHCAAQQPARPVVLLLPFAETLVPAGDASYRTPEDRAVLVYLRKWAQDPGAAGEEHRRRPGRRESRRARSQAGALARHARGRDRRGPTATSAATYLEAIRAAGVVPRAFGAVRRERLAELIAGMTRVQLGQLLDGADADGREAHARATCVRFKKEVIETEGLGLLEYVEPKYDLSMVAGMPAVKERLRRAARAIAARQPGGGADGLPGLRPGGQRQDLPGRVLRRARSAFPASSSRTSARCGSARPKPTSSASSRSSPSLTPVGVMVDEADAALGNREQGGDSGTQSRVFAQIATFMGDTRNRGKILWFLITARPDLLPIDLKRQGRAEEHIPLFYPETVAEYDEIFAVMKKKLAIKTTVEKASDVAPTERLLGLSGSDLEAVLVRAILEAEADETGEVTAEHLKHAFADFIPTTNTLERELQILYAVLECTSRELLPPKYRNMDRADIQARVGELLRLLRR